MVTPPQKHRLLAAWIVWVLVAMSTTAAHAQPRRDRRPPPSAPAADPKAPARPEPRPDAREGNEGKDPKDAKGKAKVFDFTGLDISGRLRAPQLLYFLERANEELERASLERRSFIPEMMRSVEEEQL